MASLYSQIIVRLPKPTRKYTGLTVVVTGSNVGLGLEAARWFVKLDAKKVILAVRSLDKGEAAKKDIEASCNRTGVVEVMHFDAASYASVKENAAKLSQLERIDVLVENAGIVTYKFKLFEDNESTITTNVVSPLLHGLLMLPKLRETAQKFKTTPNLVFTSSFVHAMTKFPEQKERHIFEALADEKKTDMTNERYFVSKLLEMYAVEELAQLTRKSPNGVDVIINDVNPGMVVTDVMREFTGVKAVGMKVLQVVAFFRNAEVGSRTLMNAAEGGKETHGQYMNDCKIGK